MGSANSNPQIILRPQDLVVLFRLSLESGAAPSYATLADELNMTASEIHAGLNRALAAQLVRKSESGKVELVREAFRVFVMHGARYSFPPVHGAVSRGMPTSYAAPPMKDKVTQSNEPIPVWPYKNGSVRGVAFYPLYPTVPATAEQNPALYELLVLFDAVRGGSNRERALAIKLLDERIGE